jgi:hypothetical protein
MPRSRSRLAVFSTKLIAILATVFLWSSCSDTTEPEEARDPTDPELPRVFIDTRYQPPSGITIVVNAGADLQAALDAADPGDVLVLEAGASFEGSFTLPAKSGDDWIVIRSSAPDAQLPPQGERIDPSFADAMPKLVGTSSLAALKTQAGAHRYRIIGLEITVRSDVTLNYGIVTLGDGGGDQNSLEGVAHDIVIDRSYIHGHENLNVSRCVALNSATTAIIDSYLSECHAVGFDSQAIGGWNGPGPFKILNNYLEGSGENVMFGGADPAIDGLIPSDIEIRGNHFYKPAGWRGGWTVKNLFELKNAQRLLVEGNVFENNWADAQVGFALVWKSANQSGGAPWSGTRDVTFRYNIVRNSTHGLNLSARGSLPNDIPTSRVKVHDNLFEKIGPDSDFGGDGRLFQLLNDHRNIKLVHNTGFCGNSTIIFDGSVASGFVFADNAVNTGTYGVKGSGSSEGIPSLDEYVPGYVFVANIVISGDPERYPDGNFFPATMSDVGFADWTNGDYRLLSGGAYSGAGSDGHDPGADIDAVAAATAGVVRR